MATESVLIVEDEDDWRSIYRRAAKRQGFATIEEAGTFAGAKALLRCRKYGVAVVDVGLDVGDDSNVDGLRVMEFIRDLGDETSIVVVTGRSGSDVVAITRDALVKYQAFDTVGKSTVEPSTLQGLLAGATAVYKEGEAKSRRPVHEVLRGATSATIWDDQMLSALKVARGVEGLHAFLDGLFARFLPVVFRPGFAGLRVDKASGIGQIECWSRGTGQAVLLILGSQAKVAAATASSATLLAEHGATGIVHSVTSGEVSGAVYTIPNGRDEFVD